MAKLITGLVQHPGWISLRSLFIGIRYVLAAPPRGGGTQESTAILGELPLRNGTFRVPGIPVGGVAEGGGGTPEEGRAEAAKGGGG